VIAWLKTTRMDLNVVPHSLNYFSFCFQVPNDRGSEARRNYWHENGSTTVLDALSDWLCIFSVL